MTDLKILLLDIETSMAKSYHYGLYDQNISIENIIEHPRMIAISAKWLGKKGVKFYSEYHHSRKEMLQATYDLLDEADVVVGWNSKRFDVKWIQGELEVEGFGRPSPFKQIDIMAEVKKNFRFVSNKLDYVAHRLLDEGKHEYSMARMWRIVDNPETDEVTRKKEWNAMKRYAIRDTALLDPLFERLRPWIKIPHPVVDSEEALCHACGSDDLVKRGYALTLTGKYRRFRCNSCGSWFRGTQRENSSPVRAL